MDSQNSKLEQDSSEMVQLPSDFSFTSSSASLTSHKPKSFNDIPDELLDPIMAELAALGDEQSLRRAALVSRRFYAPARRYAKYPLVGIYSALRLLDVALEFPTFAEQIRDLSFRYHEYEALPALGSRAIGLHAGECVELRYLHAGGLVEDEPAQARLMQVVGGLKHLVELNLGAEFRAYLPLAPLPLLVPTFRYLRRLTLGVSASERSIFPRPPNPQLHARLPSCTINDLTLHLDCLQKADIHNVVNAFARGARRVRLDIRETTFGEPILNAQDLVSLFDMWTPFALALDISSFRAARHTESLPFLLLPCAIVSVLPLQSLLRNAYAYLGTWSEIKEMPWEVLGNQHMGKPDTWRVEVRRGEEMSDREAVELHGRLRRRGFEVTWIGKQIGR